MVASDHSKILGKPLNAIKLPANTLVGALAKSKKKVIIPTGDTVIESGDKVIMVTMPESVPKLKEMLEGKDRKVNNALSS